MTDVRRGRLVDLVLLLIILATAAGARVGYLLNYANQANTAGSILVQEPPPLLMGGTTSELEWLASNVRDHRWFGGWAPFAVREEQTAHAAPGYPWLLGELQRLRPDDWAPLTRWLQGVLGTLTAGLYFLIGRQIFPGRLVAVLSGLLTALHPFWIFNTPDLNDGVLITFLLAAGLWLAVRARRLEEPLTSLLLGLTLAGLALVRAALLPLAVVLVLWMLRCSRRRAGGWQMGLLTVLGFVIGLAPWMVRNVQVFGDCFPIVNSTYFYLWVGNHPYATGGPRTEEQLLAALPTDLQQRLTDPTVSQPARYRLLGPALLAEIQRNPLGTLERRLWAGLFFFFGEDWFTHQRLWRPSGVGDLPDGSPFPMLLTATLLTMLLLGVLGWRWTYAWRREAQPLALAVVWLPLPYLLSHAGALSGPRLPLDGVLLCYTAFVLACLVPGTSRALLRPRRTAS